MKESSSRVPDRNSKGAFRRLRAAFAGIRHHAPLAAVILLAAAVRLLYLREISFSPDFAVPLAGSDAALNHELAERVAGGDLILGNEVYYYSSPLYKYLLGGIYALFGGSFWTARAANIFLGAGTVGLLYLLSLQFFQERRIALIAACGAAVYGPFVVLDVSMLKTSFALFLLILSLILLRAAEKKDLNYWGPAGFVLGLAYATHQQIGVFVAGIVLYLFAAPSGMVLNNSVQSGWSPAGRLARLGMLAAGLMFALLPFALRNYAVAQDAVFGGTGQGIHYYIGNHKGAWGGYSPVDGIRQNSAGHYYDARRIAEKEEGRQLSPSGVSRYWRMQAVSYVLHNKAEALRLLREKLRLIFSSYEIRDNGDYQYLAQVSPILSWLPGIGLLLPAGICGLVLSFRAQKRYWLLYICLLSYVLAMLLTFVTWRYRMPIALVLWTFAGYAAVTVWDSLRGRRFVLPAGVLALSAFVAVLGNAHPIRMLRQEQDMKDYEAGLEFTRREGLIHDQIRAAADRPVQDRSALWLQLALFRYQGADTEGAVTILQNALLEDPDNVMLKKYLSLMQEMPVNLPGS